MARALVWLSLALGLCAQEETDMKLVSCLALSRHVILGGAEELSHLVESSAFDQELVLTKMMTYMVTGCTKKMTPAKATEIIKSVQSGGPLDAFTSFVSVPRKPYMKESEVQLTNEEEIVFEKMMKLQEKADRHGGGGGSVSHDPDVPFVGTQAGILTILVLFVVVVGLVVYLIKTMQDTEERSKDEKKE